MWKTFTNSNRIGFLQIALEFFRKTIKRSKIACIVYYLMENWLARYRLESGRVESKQGSSHAHLSLKESLNYIDWVLNDYLEYSGLKEEGLHGKRILEIGPGDNMGIALLFFTRGAKQVVCLDRFYSKQNLRQQQDIYIALRQRLSKEELVRFDAAVNLNGKEPVFNKDKLRSIWGVGIEEARNVYTGGPFDLIVSRSVLEHLYNPGVALDEMDALLKPGGLMLHKVDLRDHGMFSRGGFHPLTFLTFSDAIYHRMSSHTARPNRHLVDFYHQKLAGYGYRSAFYVTQTIGDVKELSPYRKRLVLGRDYTAQQIELVEKIRPKLLPRYRALPTENLLISGIFITARKSVNGE